MRRIQENRPQLVDLFSGIGSASLGFQKAGFAIAAAVDADQKACVIYEKNFGVMPICEDIRCVSGGRILKSARLKRGEVDVVVGCPPCQGFSSLGRTTHVKGSRDYRNSLVRIFADRVKEILPRAVVFENVPGMARGTFRKYLILLLRRLTALGYQTEAEVLHATRYGVPQYRNRVILVAVRGKVWGPLLPQPTHEVPLTVRDVISDLPPLQSGESDPDIPLHAAPNHDMRTLELVRHIPRDGGSRTDLPRRMWLKCHRKLSSGAGSVYGRMWWDRPSPTITTRCNAPSTGRFIHPEQNRGITLKEATRLQTIPDEFHLDGCTTDLATWIGNAMPTRLGYVVGSHVAGLLGPEPPAPL